VDKSQEEKKKEVNRFRHEFDKSLFSAAKERAEVSPKLQVDDSGGIAFQTRYLKTEVTDTYRILIDHYCSIEQDFVHHLSFWPYFDEHNNVRYTRDPDNPGFSDPKQMAIYCIDEFVEISVRETQ
jgi:hypothetical protein